MLASSLFFSLITISLISNVSYCAVMHTHLHKEKQEDGAHSPHRNGHFGIKNDQDVSEFDHEAILGSSKAAEEFDHLTKEESIRRLRILLKSMDLNSDLYISPEELKAWILKSFRKLSEEEAQERLEETDLDSDEKVSWNEFITNTYGLEGDENFSMDNEDMIEDEKIMWKAADLNGDDILEGAEWVSFLHPEEYPHLLPFILNETLKNKDLDKDDAISFQEYIGDQGANKDKEWLHLEKVKFDKEFDLDSDGYLKGNEILSWVVPSNNDIADEEVDHLFEASDDNHDRKLSFDEIADHHDVFVGSEATDFGEHIYNIHLFQDEL